MLFFIGSFMNIPNAYALFVYITWFHVRTKGTCNYIRLSMSNNKYIRNTPNFGEQYKEKQTELAIGLEKKIT